MFKEIKVKYTAVHQNHFLMINLDAHPQVESLPGLGKSFLNTRRFTEYESR